MSVKTQQKYFSILAVALTLLFLAACSPNISISANSPSAPILKPTATLTIEQLLQRSNNAMKALKFYHIDLNALTHIDLQQNNVTTSQNSTTTSVGDHIAPNQTAMKTTTTVAGKTITINEVVTAGNVYVQNQQGLWYVLDKTTAGQLSSLFNTNDQQTLNNIIGIVQNAPMTDKGIENGLRHITIQLDQNQIKQLIAATTQNTQQQTQIQQVLALAKSMTSTIDVWIDPQTSYIHQLKEIINMDVDMSMQSLGSSMKMSISLDMNYSKFNVPLSISVPTGAIPTTNPSVIFGGLPQA